MNTIASIILDREVTHAEQMARVMCAVTDQIFAPAKPKAASPTPETIRQQIQELTSREAQLQAELNDVRERLTLLNDATYSRFPGAE